MSQLTPDERRVAAHEEAVENSLIINARRERDEARAALGQARKDRDDYADELQQEEDRAGRLLDELVKIRDMADEAVCNAVHGPALEDLVLKIFGVAHKATNPEEEDDELQS